MSTVTNPYKAPAGTPTKDQLKPKLDKSGNPIAPPANRKPFHEIVSGLLHQIVPTVDLANLTSELKTFLDTEHISNEDGLANVLDWDLPARVPKGTSIWDIAIVRRSFLIIAKASNEYYLENDTSFKLLKVTADKAGPGFISPMTTFDTENLSSAFTQVTNKRDSTTTASNIKNHSISTKPRYNVKSISNTTVMKYSGEFGQFKDWKEDVELQFGKSGYQTFLTDERLCTQHDDVSHSMKCILVESLQDGSAGHITKTYKNERNVAKFFAILKANFDDEADEKVREFQQWMDLFTHTLEEPDKCNEFINKHETAVSQLKEYKSIAVTDNALMRALLLRSIDCEDFAEVKLEITKNLDMEASKIIDSLRAHYTAMNANSKLMNKDPGSKTRTSRRGGVVGGGNPNDEAQGFVPKFPPGLKDLIGDHIWNQLSHWRALVNKPGLNTNEKDKLRNYEIRAPRDKGDDNSYKSKSRHSRRNDSYREKDRDYDRDYDKRDKRKSDRDRGGRNDHKDRDRQNDRTRPPRDSKYRDSRSNKRTSRRGKRRYDSDSSSGYDSNSSQHSYSSASAAQGGRPYKSRRMNKRDRENPPGQDSPANSTTSSNDARKVLMGGMGRN